MNQGALTKQMRQKENIPNTEFLLFTRKRQPFAKIHITNRPFTVKEI